MTSKRIIMAGVVVALASMLSPARADRARVAIARFEGPAAQARDARLEVIRALEGHELIPVKELEAAGGVAKDPDALVGVAEAISADAVITGRVKKKRKRYTISLAVRAGWSGRELATASVSFTGRRMRKKIKTRLRSRVTRMMAEFASAWEAHREEVAAAQQDEGDESSAAPENADGDNGPDDSAARASRPKTAAETSSAAGHHGPWGSLHAGGSFVGRSLGFRVRDTIAEAMRPPEYSNPVSAGVMVRVEAYPLRTMGAHLARLGVSVAYDQTLGLQAEVEATGDRFNTRKTHWDVGLHYRLALGRGDDPLLIRAGAGVAQLRYTIDSGDVDVGIPDVSYTLLNAGVGVRVPVMDALAVTAAARFLYPVSAGEIASSARYGSASLSGLDADVGAAYRLVGGLHVVGGVRLMRIGLSFNGDGMLSEIDQDGEPDVNGASDLYFGSYVAAAYQF